MAVFITRSGSFTFRAAFADNSWEDIILACRMKQVPETWVEGDSKKMTINGKEYQIDIIGKNHDTYADGTGLAPLTFQFHECYATKYAMNTQSTNVGGWGSSAMRNTHLPAIMATMPDFVQSAIRLVSKQTSAGGQSAVIETTADKLFLLSEIEVFYEEDRSFPGEGKRYPYYALVNSNRKSIMSGSYAIWLFRSPSRQNTSAFACADDDGARYTTSGSSASGVAPAWCF